MSFSGFLSGFLCAFTNI